MGIDLFSKYAQEMHFPLCSTTLYIQMHRHLSSTQAPMNTDSLSLHINLLRHGTLQLARGDSQFHILNGPLFHCDESLAYCQSPDLVPKNLPTTYLDSPSTHVRHEKYVLVADQARMDLGLFFEDIETS